MDPRAADIILPKQQSFRQLRDIILPKSASMDPRAADIILPKQQSFR
jgi:hypothetical protein